MRKRFVLVVAALSFVHLAPAAAQSTPGCQRPATLTAPFVFVTVNGQCLDLSSLVAPVVGGKGWNLFTTVSLAGARIDLRATFNPDPSVSFSSTTVNTTSAPMTYAVLFGTPIVPDFYTQAVSSGSLSITSATGTTTVSNSAFPAFVAGYGTNGAAATELGVNIGTNPCTVTGTVATQTCNLGSASSTFAPAFYDNLEAFLTYTQDNLGSTATLSGEVSISAVTQVTPTPEPSEIVLLGTGLSVLGGWASRRRRVAR
jgi:hypothetical protein